MSPVNRVDPPLAIIDPDYYARYGYPHRQWQILREQEPVAFCSFDGFPPFWALTRHADIVEVSSRPELFRSAPMLAIFADDSQAQERPLRHLLTMDDPDHRVYRGLVAQRFQRATVDAQAETYSRLADAVLDRISDRDEIDFVTDVAAVLPIWVVADMLGIPEEDREQFSRWTNQLIGANDPEFRLAGRDARETSSHSIAEQTAYFEEMVARRREAPTDDLTSQLANAEIDGERLPPLELISYLVLLVVAGNETTRNAASAGMLALMEHPRQLERLRRDPDALIETAVDEIVRWASPVNQFCRTPAEDVEIGGKTIRAGEHLCLFYASANRDPEVFADPYSFRVDRHPNPHLGFGIGEHACLGAHVAKRQLEALFSRLVQRMQRIEPRGPTDRLRSSFIGGIKHLPVSLDLRPD